MVKRSDVVVALLAIADLVVLILMYPLLPPRVIGTLVVYLFDGFVVVVMALSFYIKIRKTKQRKIMILFILKNWYEIVAMIPIAIFAIARSYTNEDTIVLGIMFHALGILYVLRLFSPIESNLRIFGGHKTLHTFLIFFMALAILTFLLYAEEHSVQNSQITTMGDALWVSIQTMSTSTYGPAPIGLPGKIISSITMIVGVGVTGVFISVLAAGLTRSRRRIQKDNNSLGYDTKQTIKGHIDKLEQLSEEDVHVLLSMIKSLHDSLKKSKSNL